jgi:flagellar biosynthesis protein FlhG
VIKILSKAAPRKDVGLVVNAARDAGQADVVFRQLELAASRFLNRKVSYAGFVVQDAAVRDAILGQRTVVGYVPQAPASRCFRMLASRVAGLSPRAAGRPAERSLRLVPTPAVPIPRQEAAPCA